MPNLQPRDPQTAARLMRARPLAHPARAGSAGGYRPHDADWHGDGLPPVLDPGSAIKIFLHPEREQLKQRIEERFDAMLDGRRAGGGEGA